MSDYIDLEFVVIVMAWLGSLAAIIGLALPFIQKRVVASRLRSVAARREELSRQQRERIQQEKASARYTSSAQVGLMKKVLEQFKMNNPLQSKELRDRMAQAGWRGQSAAVKYLFARLALPVAFAVLAMVLVSGGLRVLALMVGVGLGYYLPGIMVTNAIQKRQQELRKKFPDAVDLLLICVEAGLSVEAAFSRVTEDMAEGAPLLAEELGLTAAELAFLPDRKSAYENLANRTGLDVAKSLGMALIQSEKYGTPVAVALRVVSQESRDDRMARAEKKAGSLPAQLTVPMIAFFLPVLFVVIIGPAIIRVIDQVMG